MFSDDDLPAGAATLDIHNPATTDGESVRLFLSTPGKVKGIDLGHYEVREVIGSGGFGVVMKAFDKRLHRVVAIKMMSEEMAATSPARKRFIREARTAAAVRHENVVQIHDVGEEPLPYLVMEYIPGESLQQLLDRKGPLDLATVLRIGAQIASGLAAAHERNLIHRDIKPANILLEDGPLGRARLTDFGLARAADDASLTQSGVVAGTPMFMAPEQANGEPLDPRSDLFSFGSVLYVMAGGRPPFRAPTPLAVLHRVATETPRPLGEIIPEVPEWFCRIVSKLHCKDPSDRYQSAREVADLLHDCQRNLQEGNRLSDLSRIPSLPTAARAAASHPQSDRWKLLAGAGLLASLAMLGLILWQSTRQVRPYGTAESGPPGEASGGDKLRFTNGLGMKFALIPAGKSWLGGGGGAAGDRVCDMPKDFYLGVYEVTQEQWLKLMSDAGNPSEFSRLGKAGGELAEIPDDELRRFPVDSVSWEDCQEFLARLNTREKTAGWTYRLPTSEEWEYACRGGPMAGREESAFDFHFDSPANEARATAANFAASGLRRTRQVGSYAPNKLGLHDMHGNVFEICHDAKTNPEKEEEKLCPLRGGYCRDDASFMRARNVSVGVTTARYAGSGFRVARVPVGGAAD